MLLLLAGGADAGEPLCAASRVDGKAKAVYVYDGDTVKLADGRRIRLIGVNTPEVAHQGRPPEPMAEEARRAVADWLEEHPTLAVRFDRQRTDDYGRTLAHLFLPDGSSLAARLIEQGLATTLPIPPNTWNLDCHQEVERNARLDRRGLWGMKPGFVLESAELRATEGYHLVRGRVTRVEESRKSLWIHLEGPVRVRVPREDLRYFDRDQQDLKGENIIVRGWLRRHKKEVRLTLHHPAGLEVIP